MNGIFYKDITSAYIPEILTEIYRDKIYAPFVENKDDINILDIGANIGLTTLYFAQHAKKVISVEPSKQHFEVLKELIRYNKLKDIVIPINKAVGNDNGKMNLYHNKNATMFSLKDAVRDKEEGLEAVDVVTIEKLINIQHIKKIHFMKLDVEGAEAEIIGGEWFEMASERIDSLVFEYHTWCGVNPSQLLGALRDYGYRVWQIPSSAVLFGAIRE